MEQRTRDAFVVQADATASLTMGEMGREAHHGVVSQSPSDELELREKLCGVLSQPEAYVMGFEN